MKFFVSRQVEWPDCCYTVEIAQGGRDYSGPGMLAPQWRAEGEGKEFTDPREAVSVALRLRDLWASEATVPVNVSLGCTMGFTVPLEQFDDMALKLQADNLYDSMPKCEECENLLGEEKYGHNYTFECSPFCSKKCANKNLKSFIDVLKEESLDNEGETE